MCHLNFSIIYRLILNHTVSCTIIPFQNLLYASYTELPNLVQSTEGVPAFVHGEPFGNIAHGCNSVIATRAAATFADYAATKAGFALI